MSHSTLSRLGTLLLAFRQSQAGGFVTSRVKFCYVGANSLFNHFWNLAMAETKRYIFSGQDLDSILKAFEEQGLAYNG